ncbi:MAG: hypothetical protein HY395_02365 [Candidatus Doudnabacteria bacterium]|nr:hypothetical protein [Candidatus Doudnabacteria bacterium]
MQKLILLSILLTLVYSWEDLKRFLMLMIRHRSRNKHYYHNPHLDQFVATILMFAMLPVSLTFFLASEAPLDRKLIWLAGELLLISCLTYGLGKFLSRLRLLNYATGAEKIAVVTYSLAGLVSPAVRWVDPWSIERKLIGKFTFWLSLPALFGLMLRYLVGWSNHELLPHLDLLIQIVVGGLIINIAVEFLEKHFSSHRHAYLSTYFRILLGIAVGFVLIRGLN